MGRTNRETRIWKILLLIHLIAYEVFFIFSMDGFKFGGGYVHQYFITLLLWTPILLLHTGATFYHVGRGSISQTEREAYREGFADAVRQLAHQPEAVERLALDDEGELVEIEEKRKRRDG